MTLTKNRILIGMGLLVVILFLVAYIGSSWGERGLGKAKEALQKAEDRINYLQGQADSMNTEWAKKEAEYESKIRGLNASLQKRQKEIDGLKSKITKLEDERKKIVIPQSPDLICPEWNKLGYKCGRATQNR